MAVAALGTIIMHGRLSLLSTHTDVIKVHRMRVLVVTCAASVKSFTRLPTHFLAERAERRVVTREGLALESTRVSNAIARKVDVSLIPAMLLVLIAVVVAVGRSDSVVVAAGASVSASHHVIHVLHKRRDRVKYKLV